MDGDDDAIFRSQTLECELRPPKSDSYFNLYDDEQDVPLGGSAHSLRNLLASNDGTGGRDSPKLATERRLAPDAMYSPIGHVSANTAIQHLCDAHVSNDNGAHVVQKPTANGDPQSHITDAAVLPSDAKYPTAQALAPDDFGAGVLHIAGRWQGRISPTKAKEPMPSRTALAVDECEVLAMTDVNIGGSVRRPMSFVKALELSDRLAANEEAQRKRYGTGQLHDVPVPEVDEEDDDSDVMEKNGGKQQFGSSYEIAV